MLIRRLLTYSVLSFVALGGFFGSVYLNTQENNNSTILSYRSVTTTFAEVFPATQPSQISTFVGPPAPPVAATPTEASKMYNSLINGMNIILGVITVIVSPAIMFAGWLMSPDWTSGDLFGLRTPMYSLWVTVSNIVYFVYAILLILIALGTMFGKESFSYKVMLPKLALGILMVPFTWWFVQWTISLSAVVTASVITIPAETMKTDGSSTSSWWNTPSIPMKIIVSESGAGALKQEKVVCNDTTCQSPQTFLTKSSGMYGYMMVYAYSIFKFQEVKQLNTVTDIIKEGVGIVHQGIIAAIMFLVFGLLTLALVAMLLVRAIKLWVYAIFSPLFTFQFVAGSAMMGGDKDTFTIKEFVGLCFVPAIVGLALSFGLIMISAVSSGTPTAGNTAERCTEPKLISEQGCLLANIMGNPQNSITRKIINSTEPLKATTVNIIKFGGIEMEFLGKAGASQDDALKGANNTTGVLNSAGGIFGTLIIDIIALVFIWMAFMAAKNVSKAVKMAVEPFEKIGQQVGSLAKSIPKYTPIPGLGMSANSLSKVPDKIQAGFETRSNEKAAESALGKLIGLDGKLSKDYAQLKVVQGKAEMSPSELNELQKNVQNIVGTKGTLSEEGKKAMEDWVEILKKNKTKISLDDSKLNASLISGGKLTQEGEQILLGKLSDSTYIKKPGEAEKLAKANPNYVPGTGGTSGASTSIITAKIELTKDGTNKITVLNEPIQFKLKDNGDIDGTITGLDKLKDKKTGMTKEAFTTILQSSGNITKNAADKIAKEAEDITGFFESK